MPRRQLRSWGNTDEHENENFAREGSGAHSLASLTPGYSTTTSSTFKTIASGKNSLEIAEITPAPVAHQKLDVNAYYITLTVTNPTTTYTTRVLLGDSTSTALPISKPGLTTADLVGIVFGVVGGVAVLLAILYVYFLRLRVLGRTWTRTSVVVMKTRKKRKIGSAGSGSGSGAPAA